MNERFADEAQYAIVLFKGFSNRAQPLFAYLAVPHDEIDAFKQEVESGTIVLERHAHVLLAGFNEPTEEDKKIMEEQFGFDHSDNARVWSAKDGWNNATNDI